MNIIDSEPCNTMMIQSHQLMQPLRQSGLLITESQAENGAERCSCFACLFSTK